MVMSHPISLTDEEQSLASSPDGPGRAIAEPCQTETASGSYQIFQEMDVKEHRLSATRDTILSALSGPTVEAAVGAATLVGAVVWTNTTDIHLYLVVGSFMSAIVEVLRNSLTCEQASAVLTALHQCVVRFPEQSERLLHSDSLVLIAHWLGNPNSPAASLMGAIVRGYMEDIKDYQ
jgi:hypothetical protein